MVVARGDASLAAVLAEALERYRYFTGTLKRAGRRGLRLRLESAADVSAEPPPAPLPAAVAR